jgi:NAD(P)H-flavin reductase
MNNIYHSNPAKILSITEETPDVKTFKLEFQDETLRDSFDFKAGQFGLYSVFGEGESTFCIASPPTRKGYIECSVKKVGRVTSSLHNLDVGDTVGFRGPYGNNFPLEDIKGKNVVFIAGGIGLAPVRCLIQNCLDLRSEFKDITIIYGSRSVADLVYKDELKQWEEMSDVRLVKTVDPGGETDDWDGKVGFVPTIVEEAAPKADNCVAVICGPPIMIKFTLPVLNKLGFNGDNIITTLENRMKCGLGKCGRCNVGSVYICKDGPVFTYDEVMGMLPEF